MIDFGGLGVGDPAPDGAAAFWTFRGDAWRAYQESIGCDDATWRRARGWALRQPSLRGETRSSPPDPSGMVGPMFRFGVAGDWHGNRSWALRGVSTLASAGVVEVYHLGDFGIWPGPSGRTYLLDLERSLATHAMTLFVTPGNHEDYDQIAELPALDRGHDIGEVQWITDHIALLPRGHRWTRHGCTFVSLGGAPSVDRGLRREGLDWWEAEAITDNDVARVVAGGTADVMLAHDAPDAALGTPGVAAILNGNPLGWPAYILNYAAEGRNRLTKVFLAVKPRLFLHGHYHLKDEAWLGQFGHRTHVVSVDCDGSVEGNLAVVTLPDWDAGAEPALEWLRIG